MLTSDQQSFFWSNGYLPVGRVSVPLEVVALKDEFVRLVGGGQDASAQAAPEDHLMRSSQAEHSKGHVRVGLHVCHLSGVFRAHALNRRIVSMLCSLFGEDPVVLTSLLFNKPAMVGDALTLHQDLPYYPYLGDDDLITCWTALDAVTQDNGPVEYLPGSHRSRLTHRHTGLQQALDIDPALVDVSQSVSVLLEPGEAVLHHGLTVHRSGANASGRPRMGVATLYLRASAKVSLDDFPYPVLVPSSEPSSWSDQ